MTPRTIAVSVAAAGLLVAGQGHAARVRMFSYDPGDAATRAASGPMTFEFKQGLLRPTILTLRSTEVDATVEVMPVSEAVLGGARLTALAGPEAADRDLYAIRPTDDGAALIAALCPGSTRGWLAIERPGFGRNLGLDVLGNAPSRGAKLCRKLSYVFHGEWRGPASGKYDTRLSDRARGPHG